MTSDIRHLCYWMFLLCLVTKILVVSCVKLYWYVFLLSMQSLFESIFWRHDQFRTWRKVYQTYPSNKFFSSRSLRWLTSSVRLLEDSPSMSLITWFQINYPTPGSSSDNDAVPGLVQSIYTLATQFIVNKYWWQRHSVIDRGHEVNTNSCRDASDAQWPRQDRGRVARHLSVAGWLWKRDARLAGNSIMTQNFPIHKL